jgi:NAD-dependent dihydropyrimidine dehydrogenase PreA subunit
MIGTSNQVRVVWYEPPGQTAGVSSDRTALIAKLLDKGIPVKFRKADDSSAHKSAGENEVKLSNFGGNPPTDSSIKDVHGLSVDDVVTLVQQGSQQANPAPTAKRWKPWFPVIDFNRCTNCMQCLSFCLFDVYGATNEGKIQVQNESNCKTDCPACSRVCPEVAIMFPKYKAGPINGDEVNSEDLRREAMKVDISALLGGDIYSMLRDRSAKAKSRFSKERDDDRALQERQRCMEKLKTAAGGFDIPPEVMASLPSLDQIQAKAAQARERAAKALEGQVNAKESNTPPSDSASAEKRDA